MRRQICMRIFVALGIIGLSLNFSCSKKPLKGTPTPNKSPQLTFANIPPDSTVFQASPIISWYATDVDGDVWQYCIADIPKTKFPAEYMNFYRNPASIPDSLWRCMEETRDTIFFSVEPGDSITEHLFCVRAIDNEGAYSNYVCRIYFRTNRPPDTDILTRLTEMDTLWCLAETTANWKGININWTATDPDNSIMFEYYWFVLSDRGDTVKTSGGWITSTYTRLKGLQTGHYYFYVKARDDAFEPDPTPDSIPLNIVKPYFDWTDEAINHETIPKNVLLVNETSTGMLGDPRTSALSQIQEFYTTAFNNLVNEGVIDNFTVISLPTGADIPSKLLLSQNVVVYWFGIDIQAGMSDNHVKALKDYMDIGGRLGLESRTIQEAVQSFMINYLGIYNVQPDSNMQGTRRDYYFRRAIPQISDYPELVVDSVRAFQLLFCAGTVPYLPTLPSVSGLRTIPNYMMTPTKYVEVVYRYGVEQYDTTSSRYPLSLVLNNLPVAVRYVNGVTRSLTMSFPTCLMQNGANEAYTAIKKNILFLLAKPR